MWQGIKNSIGGAAKKNYEQAYYVGEIVAKLGLLLAGAFAIYQFYEAREAQRISRTLVYVDRFERGDVAEARQVLRAKLRPYYKQFADMETTGVRPEDRDEMVLLFIEEDPGEIVDALENTADFFEGLKLCIDVEQCDRRVAVDYFCPSRSVEIWDDFSPYFRERRVNNPKFGTALEWCASGGD